MIGKFVLEESGNGVVCSVEPVYERWPIFNLASQQQCGHPFSGFFDWDSNNRQLAFDCLASPE
jgi:hypothetical protein